MYITAQSVSYLCILECFMTTSECCFDRLRCRINLTYTSGAQCLTAVRLSSSIHKDSIAQTRQAASMPYPQRWTEDSTSAWRWSVQPHSRLQSSQVIGHILLSQICSACSSSLTLKIKNQRVFSSGVTNLPWVSAHSLTIILNYFVRNNECTRLKSSYYYWW